MILIEPFGLEVKQPRLLAGPEEVAGIIVGAEALELACLGRSSSAGVEPEGSAFAVLAIAIARVELTVQFVAE